MNAFREALADKYHQYRIPSLEEVLEKTRGLKRAFPNVDNHFFNHIEKDMTRIYNQHRRELTGWSIYSGLGVASVPVIVLGEINRFKKTLEHLYILTQKALDETNKVPLLQEQKQVFDSIWANVHGTINEHREKLKREEEVEEPLITPVPKEMGTTNPLVRPDATETINPLARK